MDVVDEPVATDQPQGESPARFDAFVSYSHAIDGQLAPALQQGLQTLGKPWYRRRVLHVFRDQTSLTASPGLWDDIEKALSDARFFILLASPEAAQSPWVRKEVSWWLEHRPRERLLIVITDGGIAWDETAGGFDPERSSGLPDVLLRCFAAEPLWVDLRWARAERQLSPRDPRFRDCVADLAAPLRGVAKDDLIGEDIRNHRRALRLAWGAAAGLAVLAAAAAIAAIVAIGQRNAAQRETRLATSRQLAAQSQADAPSRLDTALLLSRAAWRTAQTPQALAALLQANTASPQLVALTTQPARITSLVAAPDASLIVTGAVDGSIRLWRPGSGAAVARIAAPARSAITALALRGDRLVAGDAGGQVGVYSLSARSWIWPVQGQTSAITAVGLDATGGVVASAAVASNLDSSIVLLSRAAPHAPTARLSVSPLVGSPITELGFSSTRFVVGSDKGQEFAWSLTPPFRYLGTSTSFTVVDGGNIGAYSPDLATFAVSGGGTRYAYREATSPTGFGSPSSYQIEFPPTAPNPPLAIALAPGGRRVAVSGSGIMVLDALSAGGANAALATTALTGLASPGQLAFPDQDHVVATDGNTLAVWDLRQLGRIALTFASPLLRVSQMPGPAPTAISPDGRYATWVEPTFSLTLPERIDCSDLRSLRILRSQPLRDSAIYSVAYNRSGTRLVTAGGGSFELWQVRGGCPTAETRSLSSADTQFRAAGFRDARTVVVVGEGNTVRVIDASSGRQLTEWRVRYRGFVGDPQSVWAAAISGDGQLAAIGLDNGRLVEVNTHTGAERSLIGARPEENNLAATGITDIAWSGDGRDIAAIEGNGDVVVLRRNGQPVMNVQGLGAESLQFLLGGSAVMGVDAQGMAHVWDIASGSILSSFPVERFAPAPRGVVFPNLGGGTSLTPLGRSKLLITDFGAYPAIFDFGLPGLLRDACQVAGRQLTQAEIGDLAAPAPADAWRCQ